MELRGKLLTIQNIFTMFFVIYAYDVTLKEIDPEAHKRFHKFIAEKYGEYVQGYNAR